MSLPTVVAAAHRAVLGPLALWAPAPVRGGATGGARCTVWRGFMRDPFEPDHPLAVVVARRKQLPAGFHRDPAWVLSRIDDLDLAVRPAHRGVDVWELVAEQRKRETAAPRALGAAVALARVRPARLRDDTGGITVGFDGDVSSDAADCPRPGDPVAADGAHDEESLFTALRPPDDPAYDGFVRSYFLARLEAGESADEDTVRRLQRRAATVALGDPQKTRRLIRKHVRTLFPERAAAHDAELQQMAAIPPAMMTTWATVPVVPGG